MLLGCHTMILCPSLNFIAYYLLDRNVSDGDIGVLIAVACLIAIVLQQILGRMIDGNLLDGRIAMIVISTAMSAIGFWMTLMPAVGSQSFLFGTLLCFAFTMLPVLNSFSFFYQNRGISVNFGVARGVGSLCFAACSIVLGFLTVRFGSIVVPLSFGVLCAILSAILFSMPTLKSGSSRAKSGKSLRLFKFPTFALMLGGLSLVMLAHNMTMTYFIHVVERAGGDSSDMGIALGLAAALEIPVLFLYTRIKGRTPSKYFLAVSGAAFFAKSVLFVFAQQVWMIYAIQSLQFLAYGLMAAARVYYVDEVVGQAYETTGQAYASATETIGLVLGSIIGGFLMQHLGVVALLVFGAIACGAGMVCMIFSAREILPARFFK